MEHLTDPAQCLNVSGFRTAWCKAGIKSSEQARGDLGMIVCDKPAVCAGVFTQSRAQAAPVYISRERISSREHIRAVLINSGNANACTGPEGEENCYALGRAAASHLNIAEEDVVFASTGVIGHQLPVDLIRRNIPELAGKLGTENGFGLAETIMTTDLVPKWTCVRGEINGAAVTVSGIAKGSGMIAPNMATMLSFVCTDAAVSRAVLENVWKDVTARTFNCVTVDTDTSTNDSAFIFSSGMAGNTPVETETGSAYEELRNLVYEAVLPLARMIAADGEGATKLITVRAEGFGDDDFCRRIARTVAESPLVKTAVFGNDPNWGRIIAAAGRAGVDFKLDSVNIHLCGVCVFSAGGPCEFDRAEVSSLMKEKEMEIKLHCSEGGGSALMYTCDYSYDYIRINAEYHT